MRRVRRGLSAAVCAVLGAAVLLLASPGQALANEGNVTIPSPPKNLNIPGCGSGQDGERIIKQTAALVTFSTPISGATAVETRTTRSGESRVYQSQCQTGRLVSGLRASAAKYAVSCAAVAGGATVVAGAAGAYGKMASLMLGGVSAYCGVSAYKLTNLADALNSANLGCGTLGIAYDAKWNTVNGGVEFLELEVANFWCQPGPGDQPRAQPVPSGPFGFVDRLGEVGVA